MFIWLSAPKDLYKILDKWRSIGTNYNPDQPVDDSWHIDGYEASLGIPEDSSFFDSAANKLFRYDFYPKSILSSAADFIRENRPLTTGDRIIQRIRVIPGILDVVSMNMVTAVWHEHDRRGFTVVSSEQHYEMGEFTVSVVRKRSGKVSLMLHTISKPSSRLPFFATDLARKRQIEGHRQALAHFPKNLYKA